MAPGPADPISIVVAGLALFLPLVSASRIRVRRPRRPRPRGRLRTASLIGLAMAASETARDGRPDIYRPQGHTPAPPWSEPDGFIPPHPSGRTGGESHSPQRKVASVPQRRSPKTPGTYLVRPGDSLWSIASEWLRTDEPARIARYWPRIHRANRSIIGADPNLILPGQVLTMPPEKMAS